MMGRQVLGAIPVGRRVLAFAMVEVAGDPLLEGQTVGEAFRAGAWRVLALDLAGRARRGNGPAPAGPQGESGRELTWQMHPGYLLRPGDRVEVAATRRGRDNCWRAHRRRGRRRCGGRASSMCPRGASAGVSPAGPGGWARNRASAGPSVPTRPGW